MEFIKRRVEGRKGRERQRKGGEKEEGGGRREGEQCKTLIASSKEQQEMNGRSLSLKGTFCTCEQTI